MLWWFYLLTLLLSFHAVVVHWSLTVFQPGKVSLVVVSCGFRTETKGKDSFSNTKDLPFILNCSGHQACVVKRSGRKHLQMEVGKSYLLQCHGFLCFRDGQSHWELSPPFSRIEQTLSSTSTHLTYAVKGWHTLPHKSSREVGFSIS